MNTRSMADKVFELSEQFNRYVFEHPEILDKIPDNAVLILLDVDDPEFNKANTELAERSSMAPGSQRVYVRMQKRVRVVQKVDWEADILQVPKAA